MQQLILHLVGDYILQSDWAANNKTSNSFACFVHVCLYSVGFLLLKPSWAAFSVIFITHFFIDRFRLAKYLCYAKNFLAPLNVIFEKDEKDLTAFEPDLFVEKYRWENCKATGYPSETPAWLAVWLMIIADNTLHLAINYLALRYL